MFHCDDYVTLWLNQGSKLIDTVDLWLKENQASGDLDLSYTNISSFFVDSPAFPIGKFLHSLDHQTTHVQSIGFGEKKGNHVAGNTLGLAYTNVTEGYEEVCCNYTKIDLMEGTRDDLPGPLYVTVKDYDTNMFSKNPFPAGGKHYDFRLLDWYAIPSSHPNSTDYFWTHFATTSNKLTSSISKNFFDLNGEFIGVIGVWFLLENFNSFLDALELESGTLIMIDAENDLLLASSDASEEDTYFLDEKTGLKTRISPQDSNDAVIREISKCILDTYGDYSKIDNIESTIYKTSDGVKYHVMASKVSAIGGFNILNVYYVKSSEVFGDIRAANVVCVIIGLSLIFVLSLCSSLLICVLLSPLYCLAMQMKKIETMKLKEIRYYFSCFFEIRQLNQRYKACVKKLIEYSAFLPSYLKFQDQSQVIFNSDESDISSSSDENKKNNQIKKFIGSIFCKGGQSTSEEQQQEQHEVQKEEEEEIEEDEESTGIHTFSDEERSNSDVSFVSSSDGSSSGSSSDSDTGDSSSTSASTAKTFYFLRNNYDLGVERRLTLCLYIHIHNWKKLIDQQLFTSKYSMFFGKVKNATKKFGTILSFNVDNIIVFYRAIHLIPCFNAAEQIIKGANVSGIDVVVGISLTETIQGVIGMDTLKTSVLFDGVVEKSRVMIDYFVNKHILGGISTQYSSVVLFDNSVASQLRIINQKNSKRFLYHPLDVLMNSEHFREIVWMLSNTGLKKGTGNGNVEWMYAYTVEYNDEMNTKLEEIVHRLFRKNDLKEGKRLLLEYFRRITEGGLDMNKIRNNQDNRCVLDATVLLKMVNYALEHRDDYRDFGDFMLVNCHLLQFLKEKIVNERSLMFIWEEKVKILRENGLIPQEEEKEEAVIEEEVSDGDSKILANEQYPIEEKKCVHFPVASPFTKIE